MLHILNKLRLYLFIVLNEDRKPHYKNTLFSSNFGSKYAHIKLKLPLYGI